MLMVCAWALTFGISAPAAFAQSTYYLNGPIGVNTPFSFTGGNGFTPYAGSLLEYNGDFYGTTFGGGASDFGTIYKISPNGTLTTLYAFTDSPDGAHPAAGLVLINGSFYGTTYWGGTGSSYQGHYGAGTIFRCTPTFDLAGNESCALDSTTGRLPVLYSFSGSADGANPWGNLVPGSDGSLYGSTIYGGANDNGAIFRCTITTDTNGNETCAVDGSGLIPALYTFSATDPNFYTNPEGANPFGTLVWGSDGSLYGTTVYGGTNGSGTIFRCTIVGNACDTTNGLLVPLYTFGAVAQSNPADPNSPWVNGDGANPFGGLALGSDGSFYGTAAYGGAGGNGTIFRCTVTGNACDTTSGLLPLLYTFSAFAPINPADPNSIWVNADGATPFTALTQGADGSWYGSASGGGSWADAGTIFKCTITSNGVCATFNGLIENMYTFTGDDGRGPYASLLQTSDQSFWGTTPWGGTSGGGVLFQLKAKTASTVTATGGTFTYDGLTHPAAASATGTVDGQTLTPVTVTYNGLTAEPVDAGTYAVIATFDGDTLHLPSSATTTIVINKSTSTVTINGGTFTYDGQAHPATAWAIGGAAGVQLPVSVSYTDASNNPVTVPIAAGTYAVTATFAGDANNLPSSGTGTIVIARAPLTITANDASRAYNTANPSFTASYSGFVNGETTSVLQGTLVLSTSATPASLPGTYPITPSGVTASNYAIAFVDGVLTVQKAVTSVTITGGTFTYDGLQHAATATVTGGVGSSFPLTVTYNGSTTVPVGAGSYAVVATYAGDTYNSPSSGTGTIVINRAPLTITADSTSRPYGVANPAFTATYSGFVNGENASVLQGTLLLTTTATTASLPGTYPITASGVTASNYAITFVDGVLTVLKSSTTVTVTGGSFSYDGLPHAATATATGIGGSLTPVTITYNGSSLVPVGAGTYAVVATYAGDANNSPATGDATIVISPVPLTITADSASRNYGAPNPPFTATYSGFVNGETPSVLQGTLVFSTPATAQSLPGTYPITPSGVVSSNYVITFVAGVLTVVNVPPTAVSDLVYTLPDTPITIQVLNNDTDPEGQLTLTAVSTPDHGTAVISGSAIVYSPATGFSGNDSFTYTVGDAYGGTATATVTVVVGGLGRFVVFSSEFTWLKDRVVVTTGDVGANARRKHDHGHNADFDDGDTDDITVRLGPGATMLETTSRVVGDTVALAPQSSIYGLVDNFLINHGGTILGTRVDTMPVPFVAMPAFPAVTAGRQNITVSRNRPITLAAGSYGKVHVTAGATLTLDGGLYQIQSLDVDRGATVLFASAVDLRIVDTLDADRDVKLITAPGVRASQAVIYVANVDDKGPNRAVDSFDGDAGGHVAANIGENSVVQANIYAQTGSVWLKSNVQATGAFIGQHVRVGSGATLKLDSAF